MSKPEFPQTIWAADNTVPYRYELCQTFGRLPNYAIYYRKSGKFPIRVHISNIGSLYFKTESGALREVERRACNTVDYTRERLALLKGQKDTSKQGYQQLYYCATEKILFWIASKEQSNHTHNIKQTITTYRSLMYDAVAALQAKRGDIRLLKVNGGTKYRGRYVLYIINVEARPGCKLIGDRHTMLSWLTKD